MRETAVDEKTKNTILEKWEIYLNDTKIKRLLLPDELQNWIEHIEVQDVLIETTWKDLCFVCQDFKMYFQTGDEKFALIMKEEGGYRFSIPYYFVTRFDDIPVQAAKKLDSLLRSFMSREIINLVSEYIRMEVQE